MLTIVADTNVYISALAFGGLPEKFLRLADARAFTLAISAPIHDEIAKVLRSEKFQWPEKQIAKAQRQIARFTTPVQPSETLDLIPADPSDNRILECAAAARADYLVSGDKHLLRLHRFGSAPVIKVAEFMQIHLPNKLTF